MNLITIKQANKNLGCMAQNNLLGSETWTWVPNLRIHKSQKEQYATVIPMLLWWKSDRQETHDTHQPVSLVYAAVCKTLSQDGSYT